jgi:hypothetical protein
MKVLRSLRFQVRAIEGIQERPGGNAFFDDDSRPLELLDLVGIVRNETDPLFPERFEHAGGCYEVSLVFLASQSEVGLERVESFQLQTVGFEFPVQPDATAFVPHVEQEPTLDGEQAAALSQLRSAIAAQRAEDVTG